MAQVLIELPGSGGVIRFRRPDEDEAARAARLVRVRAEQEKRRRSADRATLAGITFPVYAAEGRPARIGERAIARETDAHRTGVEPGRPPTDGLSDAAATLRFRASRRHRITAAHRAPEGPVQITITARRIEPRSLDIRPVADPLARLLGTEPRPVP